VDCALNSADNETVQCFTISGKPDQYLFDPNLQMDKIISGIQFKEEQTIERKQREDVIEKSDKESGKAASAAQTVKIKKSAKQAQGKFIKDPKSGRQFVAIPSIKNPALYELYDPSDVQITQKLGYVNYDPFKNKFSNLRYI
jgi:hypothetical protein